MSDKFLYQNARVKSMEKSLFTEQSVGRLLDCASVDSAFKALADMGFGSGASAQSGDFDALFKIEEQRAVELLKEFNADGAFDVFLAQYDFLNLKAAFKSGITKKACTQAPNGNYDFDEIKGWLDQDAKADIPEQFKDVVAELKKLAQSENASPRLADCIADRAEYKYIFGALKKSDRLQKKYFTVKADSANLSSFLRCKRLDLPKQYFSDGFIEGGELDFLPSIYEQSLDELKQRCKGSIYSDWVEKAVDDNDLVAFEVAMDNALLKIFKDEKDDLFGVAPILSFYLTKLTQIKVAKVIVAGVKNRVDKNKIKERIRDLYA